VAAWLGEIGLLEYATNFTRNDVDGDGLTDVDMAVMKQEFGISSFGHRRRIFLQYTGDHSLDQKTTLPPLLLPEPAAEAPAEAAPPQTTGAAPFGGGQASPFGASAPFGGGGGGAFGGAPQVPAAGGFTVGNSQPAGKANAPRRFKRPSRCQSSS
jgi:hypothetical protein